MSLHKDAIVADDH